jgi:hypothetical protein
VKRRHFIALLGSTVAGKTVAAGELWPERMRRIGILTPGVRGDPEVTAALAVFLA